MLKNESILQHSGLVENFISNMFILPKSGIGVVLLVNMNDYLVTDSMMDSISDRIILMLKGKEPVAISKIKYLNSHLLLDGIYLVIFLIALLPLLFLVSNKKKLENAKASKTFVSIES